MTITKTLTKATPTVDLAGKATKWEVEVEYVKDGYTATFNKFAEVEATKAPEAFTKAELLELADEAHLDTVFDSMYESTHSTEEPTESKVDGFDVDSLA
jgi:hypothetical protein